jgi:hypothetical protein
MPNNNMTGLCSIQQHIYLALEMPTKKPPPSVAKFKSRSISRNITTGMAQVNPSTTNAHQRSSDAGATPDCVNVLLLVIGILRHRTTPGQSKTLLKKVKVLTFNW